MDEPPPTPPPESEESAKKSNQRGIMFVVFFAASAFSLFLSSQTKPRFDTSNIPTYAPSTLWPASGHEFEVAFESPPKLKQEMVEGGGTTDLVLTAELLVDDSVMQAQVAPLPLGRVITRDEAEAQAYQFAQNMGLKDFYVRFDASSRGHPVATLKGYREISEPGVPPVRWSYQVDFHYGAREWLVALGGGSGKNYPSVPVLNFLSSVRRTP